MEDFSSNYEILVTVLNTFTVDTEDYSLGIIYRVNDANALKNL